MKLLLALSFVLFQPCGFDAFEGNFDGADGAILLEDEAVDAGDAVVTVGLAGATLASWGDDELLAVGGVNRNVFLGGIQGIFPMPDYLLHEPEWYRFNPHVLVYSTVSNQWRTLSDSPLAARAGASLVVLPEPTTASPSPAADAPDPQASAPRRALLLGGELKPGIRSTDVTLISTKEEE